MYLDNAATRGIFANASSPHALGQEAREALKKARQTFAELLQADESEVYFTSGGTEANNLGIIGSLTPLWRKNKKSPVKAALLGENHPSVVEPIKHTREIGVTEASLAKEAAFIACTYVCGETGDIFDFNNFIFNQENKICFIDGAQAFPYFSRPLLKIPSLYTISGHKFGAPLGVGILLVDKNIKIQPLTFGGGQEKKLRPGTENIAAIRETAELAQKIYRERETKIANARKIKAVFESIALEAQGVRINGKAQERSPFILSFFLEKARGDHLTNMLSQKNIYVSTGAACKSRAGRSQTARLSFSGEEDLEKALLAKQEIIKAIDYLNNL